MNYSTITKLESRIYKNPTVGTITKISGALDVGVEDLIGRLTSSKTQPIRHGVRIHKRPRFTFIDLFAGIGGIRLGFERHGGISVFSSEIDKYACQTYHANFGEYPAGDITQISAEGIPDHDILIAGFPCQPFSIAGVSKKKSLGKQHGFLDEAQGTLFFDIARVAKNKKTQDTLSGECQKPDVPRWGQNLCCYQGSAARSRICHLSSSVRRRPLCASAP